MKELEQERINNLANQIILVKYPIWKQLNLIDLKRGKFMILKHKLCAISA